MNRFSATAFFCLLTQASLTTVLADVAVPTLFSDHAVLQRNMNVPVWGTASPGENVTVRLADGSNIITEISSNATSNGDWLVYLPALPASAAPLTMTITGNNEITISEVQVGEVWVGSGQSNMYRPISGDADYALALELAADLNLAFFNVSSGSPSSTVWEDSNAGTVGDMSAVLFWFGRRLAEELPGVPIGLIHSAVSATAIERWSTAAGSGNLYEKQIVPLQPYGIRGVTWYQGEWDSRGGKDSEDYYWQLPALIEEWRMDWDFETGPGDPPYPFPFYVVQLPRMGISGVHIVRDAQLQTALAMDGVEVTVNIDYPEIDVHPPAKQEFGNRLANIALHEIHGQTVSAFGPVYNETASCVDSGSIIVAFDHYAPRLQWSDSGILSEWEIADSSGQWFEANAVVADSLDAVIVTSPSVADPVSARYAFAPAPANPNLSNGVLPASPIREVTPSIGCGTPPPVTEICDNGLDDDGDGLIDGEDPDCEPEPPSCSAVGNSCISNQDCCSSRCSKGKPANRICLQ
jgi:sialate O-acetylesterase